MSEERIVFLFSLPRSGSTLLQRILQANSRIQSTQESWFLLNLFHPIARENAYTEYSYPVLKSALYQLFNALPQGRNDYNLASKEFACHLYGKLIGDADFLLEKTPRYHLIAKELIEAFPNAKFVFLWRNPLAISSSIIETWGNGKWILPSYKVDLFDGLSNLLDVFKKEQTNFYGIRYEDLVENPEDEIKALSNFIGVEFEAKMLEKGLRKKYDKLGDQTGVFNYQNVSKAPLEKWKTTLSNPFRKKWSKNYLDFIGKSNLEKMGYDYDTLIKEVREVSTSMNYYLTDLIQNYLGIVKNKFKNRIFRGW